MDAQTASTQGLTSNTVEPTPPSHWEAARDAFGLRGDPTPLPGGVSGVLRFGGTVIKTVTDVAEAHWTQETFAALTSDADVTWARPVAAPDGRWVVGAWIANEFIPDLTPVAPDWARVIAYGARFHHATAALPDPTAILVARQHRWARGERYAFDEEPNLTLEAELFEIDRCLVAWCAPDPHRNQVVHVDLATNVFVDPSGRSVLLDISPGYRSPNHCSAVVVADALLWSGASPDLLGALGEPAVARAHVARALRFRLVTEHLAAKRGECSAHGGDLAPYRRVIDALS